MFAIIRTGGKQYRIQAGDILDVERLSAEQGQRIVFDQVLLIDNDHETLIGTPLLENAIVRADILDQFKSRKVLVFKKKRRKQFRRTKGHRQELTKLRIAGIYPDRNSAPAEEPLPAAPPREVPRPEPAAAPAKEEVRPKSVKPAKPEKTAKSKAKTVKGAEAKPKDTGKKAVTKKAAPAKPAGKSKE